MFRRISTKRSYNDELRQPQEIRVRIITEEFAVIVERTGRGSFATVRDAASEFNGESAFASVPSVAFAMLMDKVAALQTA